MIPFLISHFWQFLLRRIFQLLNLVYHANTLSKFFTIQNLDLSYSNEKIEIHRESLSYTYCSNQVS